MDRFAKLVIAILLSVVGAAHAGYAQLAPPPGFVTTPSGFGYAAAANDATFGRVIHQPNGLTASVAGQSVKMPASYRLAANAPRIAAAVIFANPALRTAVGIATWLGVAKIVWNELERRWEQQGTEEIVPPTVYQVLSPAEAGKYLTASTQQAVCNAWAGAASGNGYTWSVRSMGNGYCSMRRSDGATMDVTVEKKTNSCPVGSTPSPGGCIVGSPPRPLTEEQMVETLPGSPMPDTVPLELPRPTTLPVDPPFINPAPGPNPAHRPQFVPTGNPVRNPNYDPSAAPGPNNSPWLQPGVRMVPSPTPAEPFRVDYQPVNRPVDSSDPNPDPTPDPDDNPSDKPTEDTPDLCQLHPDILACQKLDEVPDTDLPTSEKPISITPDSGWGADNAACPAPRHLTVQGRDIPIPFDLFCRYMEGMRPIILAMAWLSAAFILLGARESNG